MWWETDVPYERRARKKITSLAVWVVYIKTRERCVLTPVLCAIVNSRISISFCFSFLCLYKIHCCPNVSSASLRISVLLLIAKIVMIKQVYEKILLDGSGTNVIQEVFWGYFNYSFFLFWPESISADTWFWNIAWNEIC